MQSEIVKETEQLGGEIGIVRNLRVDIFLERCSNLKKTRMRNSEGLEIERENDRVYLFAVTLREVYDVCGGGRKIHQRPCTSLPQLRVYAPLLCNQTHRYQEETKVTTDT